MPVPRLDITVRNSVAGIETLAKFRSESTGLIPRHQYFIAELIILRSFSILVETVSELACKLVAGAGYLKGSQPNRLFQAQSVAGARTAMLPRGRSRPLQYLRWTTVKEIKRSTSFVLDASEPYISYSDAHGPFLNEMRKVRNFIAHRNQSARAGYKEVIKSAYGANPPVDVGVFLVTTTRWKPSKIDYYLDAAKVMIRELATG